MAVLGMPCCKSQYKLPKNLDDAISYLEHSWKKAELDSFRYLPENEAVTDQHFATGQWIRNNWIYGKRDTALTNYFHSLGIYHPDDISSIILISLHRKLNNKDINLEQQVESMKNYWKPIFECEEKLKREAVANYKKWKEGDSLTIYMPVDTSGGTSNAVIYNCPDIEWQFDPKKDLIVKGTLTKRYFINDSANVFFTVYVKDMTPKEISILTKNTKAGDTRNFSLSGLKVE